MKGHFATNGLSLGWYQKGSWSAKLSHFHSFAPCNRKVGLLKGFKHQLIRICSSDKTASATDELTEVFKDNGYFDRFIKENFVDFIPPEKTKTIEVPKRPLQLPCPFSERSRTWTHGIKKYVAIIKQYVWCSNGKLPCLQRCPTNKIRIFSLETFPWLLLITENITCSFISFQLLKIKKTYRDLAVATLMKKFFIHTV